VLAAAHDGHGAPPGWSCEGERFIRAGLGYWGGEVVQN
jgi:hypothetical protein